MILSIEPKVKIPKPIGARVVIVPITTTLSIEEKWRRAGLTYVAAERSKPRNTLGIIVSLSIDPIIEENFKTGMGVYFGPLSGTELHLLGKTFRSLEFQEVISTLEEEEIPEAYKQQVREFLLTPAELTDLEV